MNLHEGLLRELIRVVGVTRESERPSKHRSLERSNQGGERLSISSFGAQNDSTELA